MTTGTYTYPVYLHSCSKAVCAPTPCTYTVVARCSMAVCALCTYMVQVPIPTLYTYTVVAHCSMAVCRWMCGGCGCLSHSLSSAFLRFSVYFQNDFCQHTHIYNQITKNRGFLALRNPITSFSGLAWQYSQNVWNSSVLGGQEFQLINNISSL